MKQFKTRASKAGTMLTGTIGLTSNQEAELDKLLNKPTMLTNNQAVTLEKLQLKKANPQLPQTIKSYCEIWLKEQYYKAHKEISSKYLSKGTQAEEDAIELLNMHYGTDYIKYDGDKFNDNFFQGTPDILPDNGNYLRDIKCSWDPFTFPLFDKVIPDENYESQVQIYMHLTGRKHAFVDYILINTPSELIEYEARVVAFKMGQALDQDVYELVLAKHCFDEHDADLRIKSYKFEYDKAIIEELKERTLLGREYINNLKKNYNYEKQNCNT